MNIGSYEVIYKENQIPALGNQFNSYSVYLHNQPMYREIGAFLSFFESKLWQQYDLCGLYSPKFFNKLNINYQIYYNFIKNNKDNDVYLFHPYIKETLIANHFLELAELEHPGITLALHKVWNKLFGKDLPKIDLVNHMEYACHCNYFSATRNFWVDYGKFILQFNNLLNSDEGAFLRALTPYTLTKTPDSYLPMAVFVFERSLSHFLFDNRKKYRIVNFATCNPSWKIPETFPGESEVVAELLRAISFVSDKYHPEARNLAINAYYYRRKLGVI